MPTDVQGLMASFFRQNQLEKQISFLQFCAKFTLWTNSFHLSREGEVGCFWLEIFELAETCEETEQKNTEQEDWRRRKITES